MMRLWLWALSSGWCLWTLPASGNPCRPPGLFFDFSILPVWKDLLGIQEKTFTIVKGSHSKAFHFHTAGSMSECLQVAVICSSFLFEHLSNTLSMISLKKKKQLMGVNLVHNEIPLKELPIASQCLCIERLWEETDQGAFYSLCRPLLQCLFITTRGRCFTAHDTVNDPAKQNETKQWDTLLKLKTSQH